MAALNQNLLKLSKLLFEIQFLKIKEKEKQKEYKKKGLPVG
jgi:predicted  nucleic acid-binding Zn-ribbon protein